MDRSRQMVMALLGAPNSGKTSIFNLLTGLRQKVGNYPGVTVDRYSGQISSGNQKAIIIDYPGCYSLYPSSMDERVVLENLLDNKNSSFPDVIVFVANAMNLERGLLMLTQICDLGFPVICVLSMSDMAEERGLLLDIPRLKSKLSIPILTVNGRTGSGIKELKELVFEHTESRKESFIPMSEYRSKVVENLMLEKDIHNPYAAHLLACQTDKTSLLSKEEVKGVLSYREFIPIRAEVEDKKARINRLQTLLLGVERRERNSVKEGSRADSVLTHRIWGSLIFIAVLFLLFQSIFTWAAPLMDWIDGSISQISRSIRMMLPSGPLTDLLCDGIIAGIGGIVIFIPQIAILFGLVAVLEESGYMTRAVYLSDRLMKRTGLNGRSIVSLISGVACAVPAIMATRTIGNWKERLITILVTPFISCSARLPVYIVLVAFIVPSTARLAGFSTQGMIMFGLYILGATTALVSAYVLSRIMKTKESSFLMMELPPYQWPQWRNILFTMYEKTRVFVVEAGKIILIISVILWALGSYGPTKDMQEAQIRTDQLLETGAIGDNEYENILASHKLEESYIGHLGKAIEPVIRPLGFDWKMGIALLTSFAAREVFVSTMATIYSTGSGDDEQGIIQRMRSETDITTGEKIYSPIRSLSLVLFYVFAMQCMSTLAVVKRETKSWSIPILQFVIMTGMAYLSSLFVWQIWG